MRRETDQLDRAILQVVSCEFQPLECILVRLRRWQRQFSMPYEDIQIQGSLLSLISDRLVNAYRLHAERPYATQICVNPDTVAQAWFLISRRGRKSLLRSQGEYALDLPDVEHAGWDEDISALDVQPIRK